jgi:peptide/nickel transport system substrate-binding protein
VTLVPDLARAIPAPTDGGLTYRFRLRRGLRYSTGALVRASDVRSSIERLHRLRAQTIDAYPLALRGERACSRRRCDLSDAIATDDAIGTVTFRLERPNPDFLLNLAAPPYAVLPAGASQHDLTGTGVVGTGAYRVASASAQRVVLERNPRFHAWSSEAQPPACPTASCGASRPPAITQASAPPTLQWTPTSSSLTGFASARPRACESGHLRC